MTVKNLFSALIGVWFIVTPWMFNFVENTHAFVICMILGSIQVIFSLLAWGKSGKKAWQSWISLFIGISFIIYPNIYHLDIAAYSLSVLLGFVTLLLNYSNLFPDN
jgi:hypothetical protein